MCRTVSLAHEAALHRAVSQLASTFATLCGDTLGKKWYKHFEVWLFVRRGSENSKAETVLKDSPHASLLPLGNSLEALAADEELQRKLTAAGMAPAAAGAVVAELGKLPTKLEQQVMPACGAVQCL
jgi:hypothetical protein